VAVEAEFVHLPEGIVAVLHVSAARQPVSTSDGRLLVRYLDTHSRPGCRPLYAYELTSWLAERGQADATALVVPHAAWDDLDPVEFARLRRMIQEFPGDATLLQLSNAELARALTLARSEGDRLVPTVAGLLLVGTETALREHVPAHEVAFQVLRGTDVAVNEFRRWPLLRTHEWLMQAIGVRNEEQELMMGGVRIGVPRYDPPGTREAINNALIHRDYTRLGAVHVQLHDGHVRVSNPGGFVLGVRADRLLAVDPHPRNPLLADAFKRVGLVERTGRGVSIIYVGQLRNGRPPPDYLRSSEASVALRLDSRPADLDFVRATVLAGRRLERTLRAHELLTFWMAWHNPPVEVDEIAVQSQRSAAEVETVLSELEQHGLIKSVAGGYELISNGRQGQLDPTSAILAYVRAHGKIVRREAMVEGQLGERQATYLLQKLVAQGRLVRKGNGRGTQYVLPETDK
jgi:ATP-dependent DNA helicase RecG